MLQFLFDDWNISVNARCDGAVCRHLAVGSSSSLALSGADVYRLLLSDDDTPWTASVAASVHRHGPHATSQGRMTYLLICSVILHIHSQMHCKGARPLQPLSRPGSNPIKRELNLDKKWQSDDLFFIIMNEIHPCFNQFCAILKLS